jgi:hypothetical protein
MHLFHPATACSGGTRSPTGATHFEQFLSGDDIGIRLVGRITGFAFRIQFYLCQTPKLL